MKRTDNKDPNARVKSLDAMVKLLYGPNPRKLTTRPFKLQSQADRRGVSHVI